MEESSEKSSTEEEPVLEYHGEPEIPPRFERRITYLITALFMWFIGIGLFILDVWGIFHASTYRGGRFIGGTILGLPGCGVAIYFTRRAVVSHLDETIAAEQKKQAESLARGMGRMKQ